MKSFLILFGFLMTFSSQLDGQDEINIADYNRAVGFMYEHYHNKKVFNAHIEPNWFPDSSGVWYVHHSVDNKKYLKVSFPELMWADLFDHKRVATILSTAIGEELSAKQLPLSAIEYRNPTELLLRLKGKSFVLNTETYVLSTPEKEASPNRQESSSPDGKWIAYSEDYNLFLKSPETGVVKALSTDGAKGYEYASWLGWADMIEGENGERPARFGVQWSENSEWLFANICDLRTAKKMHLLDWSIDSLYRPKLLSYYRGSPGDTDMVYMEPVFFNANTGKAIRPDLPRGTHINNTSFLWSTSPGKVFLEQVERGYQKNNIYSFDLNTEKLELLYSETSSTNIDNFSYRLLEKQGLILFLSEKSGWRQLYSLDLKTKKEQAITRGDFYIHGIESIDEVNRKIYFLASGKEAGRNPYYQHLYSISFTGEDLKLLSPEDRHHRISIAPNAQYFIDNFSTVNTPTKTSLRRMATGEVLLELGQAQTTDLGDWSPPETFTALARDGKTTIYGAMWKPTNFDPGKKYPVLEASYTGPHTQVFPKDFTRVIGYQPYAELGFVVIVVDGLGSSGRSKAFHDYSYKNLGGNLEDHVGAIKQLGRQYSWLDTTRVGIFGHSAGGYDAGHAVLAYPDFYKVAVASSADHDHRMEKAWWPEMYMGWPVDSAYHLQSNITMAGNLKGKLLLTHGGIDENVNPSATFKLAEALIRADKQFDMLILPSQRHGYRGPHSKYFTKLRWNYFVEHLRGVEPIWEIQWE